MQFLNSLPQTAESSPVSSWLLNWCTDYFRLSFISFFLSSISIRLSLFAVSLWYHWCTMSMTCTWTLSALQVYSHWHQQVISDLFRCTSTECWPMWKQQYWSVWKACHPEGYSCKWSWTISYFPAVLEHRIQCYWQWTKFQNNLTMILLKLDRAQEDAIRVMLESTKENTKWDNAAHFRFPTSSGTGQAYFRAVENNPQLTLWSHERHKRDRLG